MDRRQDPGRSSIQREDPATSGCHWLARDDVRVGVRLDLQFGSRAFDTYTLADSFCRASGIFGSFAIAAVRAASFGLK